MGHYGPKDCCGPPPCGVCVDGSPTQMQAEPSGVANGVGITCCTGYNSETFILDKYVDTESDCQWRLVEECDVDSMLCCDEVISVSEPGAPPPAPFNVELYQVVYAITTSAGAGSTVDAVYQMIFYYRRVSDSSHYTTVVVNWAATGLSADCTTWSSEEFTLSFNGFNDAFNYLDDYCDFDSSSVFISAV